MNRIWLLDRYKRGGKSQGRPRFLVTALTEKKLEGRKEYRRKGVSLFGRKQPRIGPEEDSQFLSSWR